MERSTENKLVLIVRKTRLDELIARFNTLDQARFYVEHLGADFSDYQLEHETYGEAVAQTERALARLGRVQVVDRAFVSNFLFGAADTVVVLGQDGLVANVLKYLAEQPVVGVNPDPARWEGTLLPFQVRDLERVVSELFAGRRALKRVTMAKATLNTGEVLYAVNDLFIGPRSHTSARYSIAIGDRSEDHSSSGVIVSTGLGSSGWLRSVLAGATGITAALGGGKKGKRTFEAQAWDAPKLVFSVREPWPSRTSSTTITFGSITPTKPLRLVSHMPEHGVIFSDGIESDFLKFNSGTRAEITIADKQGHLVA